MTEVAHAIARVLVSIVFIVFGFLQFTNIAGYAANPTVLKVVALTGGAVTPTIIAYLVAAIDLFGGLCILLGLKTRWASAVLIVFVFLTLILAHNFWSMEGSARAANMANFYKNLVIIGALIMLCIWGGGLYSVDAKLAKRS